MTPQQLGQLTKQGDSQYSAQDYHLGNLGGAAAGAGTSALATTLPGLIKTTPGKGPLADRSILRNMLKAHKGIGLSGGGGPAYHIDLNEVKLPDRLRATKPGFQIRDWISSDHKKFRRARKLPFLGALAHEYGHAGQKFLKSPTARRALSFSKMGPAAGLLGTLLSKDESTGLGSAAAGSLSSLPLIATELDASRRGTGILTRAARSAGKAGKLSLLRKLSPWIGIPSYLALGAAPLISYAVKKRLGGFEPKTTLPQFR